MWNKRRTRRAVVEKSGPTGHGERRNPLSRGSLWKPRVSPPFAIPGKSREESPPLAWSKGLYSQRSFRREGRVVTQHLGRADRVEPLLSKSDLYDFLADELGLPRTVSRKDVVFTLMGKTWDGTKWVDDFRVKLKSTREARGFTQARLAERAGLSLDGIRALEQGIRRPGTDTLRRLAVALQVGVEELIDVPEIDPASETHEVLFS